jgi:hypothetical protein
MKIIKQSYIAIIFAATLSLAACQPHVSGTTSKMLSIPAAAPNRSLIICTSKLDNSKIEYYSNQDTPEQSTFLPGVTVHYIVETNGQHVTLNNFEFKNYNCVTTPR